LNLRNRATTYRRNGHGETGVLDSCRWGEEKEKCFAGEGLGEKLSANQNQKTTKKKPQTKTGGEKKYGRPFEQRKGREP